jgi:hypothetical protein
VNAVTSPEQNFNARRIIIALVVLMTVCVVSLIVAGVTSLISLAERIHPVAGSIVFWTLILAAAWAALYCLIAYAKLPAALIPPEEQSGPKHDAYLEALRVRLALNPRTRGTRPSPRRTRSKMRSAFCQRRRTPLCAGQQAPCF